MEPEQRQAWRLLEELPSSLKVVHRWTDVREPPDTEWDYHAIPSMVACLAGVARVQKPGGHQDLGPGDCLVIGPGVWHRHTQLRRGAFIWMQGLLPAWADFWIGHQQPWYGRIPTEPARRLLHQGLHADPEQRRLAVAGLLGCVLSDAEHFPGFGSDAVQRMVGKLWKGMHLGITVDDIIAASGLGRAQAYALFTKMYGISPKAALTDGRLSLAASLLANGLTVAETARRSGWPNVDTFSRAWRRRYGTPPRDAIPAAE